MSPEASPEAKPEASPMQAEQAGAGVGRWVDRVRAWHLALLFLLLSIPALGSMPLFEPDEGRYAEIPREMIDSGDWVTPRLNGVPYFEKPAFYYWLVAGAQTALGRSELAARLASLLSALLGVLLTYSLGRKLAGPRLGAYAGLMLCVTPLWAAFARIATIDMLLSTAIAATLAAFWWASRPESGRLAWYGVFAGSALAVLTKGLIGVVLPGGVIFLYLLLAKRWRLLLRVPWLSGTLLFALIAVPWHLLVAQRNPDFLWFYFVHEHFLRYTTDIAERRGAFWYYLPVVILGFLPWSGLLPASWSLWRRTEDRAQREGIVFLAAWAGVIVLFFSVSKSKLIPYVLPAWPALALLAAAVLLRAERPGDPVRKPAIRGLAVSTLLSALLLGLVAWAATGRGGELVGGEVVELPLVVVGATLGAVLAIFALIQLLRSSPARAVPCLLLASIALFGCFVLAGVEVAQGRTAKTLARCIEAQGMVEPVVASYRAYPQTLPFYLGRQIDVVDYEGELAFGISKLTPEQRAAQYPSLEEFRPRWSSETPVFLVTERRRLAELDGLGLRPALVLEQERKLVLLINRSSPDGLADCG